jgi:hypothetical protein
VSASQNVGFSKRKTKDLLTLAFEEKNGKIRGT